MTKSELIERLARRYPQLVAMDAKVAVKMILDAMAKRVTEGLSEENQHMTRTHVKIVRITTGNEQSHLSKGQKAFNALIKQIDNRRTRLAAWEAAIPPYHRRHLSELVPLVEELMDLRVKMVQRLDRACEEKGLTGIERRKIADVITEWAGELVAARDDAQLKAIYNKHSQSDYASEEAANINGMKSVLEDMLGFDWDDELDINSPEDILERAQAQMRERQARYDANRQAREERLTKRKKSAKKLAREAQQQAEEQQLRQSIREIYRKLASALHPDREIDPQERERKTALMQRLNQAYEKNNLLQLLELQLELEHIDQTTIDGIGEDRLKHYNKILKDQLLELEQEILRVKAGFRAQFGIAPFVDVSPGTIMRDLAVEIVIVQRTIRDIGKDLLAFDDIKTLKAWLKALRYQSRMVGFNDLF